MFDFHRVVSHQAASEIAYRVTLFEMENTEMADLSRLYRIVAYNCCYQVLIRYRCACPTTVCIHMHKNDHVGMLKILWSMSEFGGLRKQEDTQHALVGLGRAALAAAVALSRQGGPSFQKGINKVCQTNK